MADTDFGALDAGRRVVWERMIWQDGRDMAFWESQGFVGKSASSPVHKVTELTATSKGDRCIMQLVQDLTSDGVVGDTPQLTGNEEELVNDEQEIRIDLWANAVRSKGKLARQAAVVNFRRVARPKLSYWLADKTDEVGFLVAAGLPFTKNLDGTDRESDSQLPTLSFGSDVTAPSNRRLFYGGDAVATAGISAEDRITWNLIVGACAFAKRARLKPVRADGRRSYVVVLSTEALRDLKQDATYQQNVGRAAPRSSKNPLFTKAVANIDDIVIHESNRVPTTLGTTTKWGAGSNVDGATCLLMGAQALGYAEIMNDETGYDELTETDYRRRNGSSITRMFGMLKPVFDSIYDGMTPQDFGMVTMRVAAAASG